MLLSKCTRKMICSIQGCRKMAVYGIGRKGNDLMLCEEHFAELRDDFLNPLDKDEVMEVERLKSEVAEAKKLLQEEAERREKALAEVENLANEKYTCKWCGESFSKASMSSVEFMAHTRTCKKEHGGVTKEARDAVFAGE